MSTAPTQPEQIAASPAQLRSLEGRSKLLSTSAALAAAGGFLDAFTYVGHGRVFANAMTGNVVLLGVDFISGTGRYLQHLLPVVMFLVGVAIARFLRLPGFHPILPRPEVAALSLEIAALFVLSWLPNATPDLVITMSVAVAASLQMSTFRQIHTWTYSSTFTTGNLRSMIESGFDWLFIGRQETHLRQMRSFAAICASFLFGASAGAFATSRYRNRALLFDVALLVAVLAWQLRDDNAPSEANG